MQVADGIQYARGVAGGNIDMLGDVRADRDERGIETIEWVIIAAIAAGLAAAVGAVIVAKVTGKANSINLG